MRCWETGKNTGFGEKREDTPPRVILINEKLKNSMEGAGITGLQFVLPKQWDGLHAGEEYGYDQFDPDFDGEIMEMGIEERLGDYYSETSLMTPKLVDILKSAGVNNLQVFEARVINAETGNPISIPFSFVNILDKISCANREASKHSPLGSADYFHELVIDEEKTEGALLFRLTESPFEIIVAEPVARAINHGGLKGIVADPL